jgi:hypothetical protein
MGKAVWWVGGAVAAVSVLLLATGYGTEPSSALDDCATRIHFQDHMFRGHNLTKQSVPAENPALGTGDVVGCESDPVDHVAVHKIRGVDSDVAITITSKHWRGVYVREGTRPSDWPQLRVAAP